MAEVPQSWIVAGLVGLAALYSIWYALPAAARQWLGRRHRWLGARPAAACKSSCSQCAGCGTASASPPDEGASEHVLRFQPKPPQDQR